MGWLAAPKLGVLTGCCRVRRLRLVPAGHAHRFIGRCVPVRKNTDRLEKEAHRSGGKLERGVVLGEDDNWCVASATID